MLNDDKRRKLLTEVRSDMSNQNKKRVTVDICGYALTLITDENENFVSLIVDTLNEKMKALTKNNFRTSSVDAALLCAIDATGDRLKAEKRIRSLEAQLALYESNLALLRAELEKAGVTQENKQASSEPIKDTISRELGEVSGASSHEDKIKALEKYLESKKTDKSSVIGSKVSREEKIKYIESLLRGNVK